MICAEIITIGDELLIGQTIDTNSAWLGENLGLIGVRVRYKTAIGDLREDILDALKRAEGRADVVIITGGLGPTRDDITKEVLCEYFETKLVLHPAILEEITAFFSQRKLPMLESNRSQAMLPESCTAIRNPRGTAPGMWFNQRNKVFVSMPGVPFEMMGMMTDTVFSMIRHQFNCPDIIHKTILTQGIGESFLAETLRSWESGLREEGLSLAYLPSPGMVKLRISSYGQDKAVGERMVARRIEELHQLIGPNIFGYDKDTLQLVVGKLLESHNLSLSAAESCTGGYLSHVLTSVPGSSQYFKGGVVSYSNDLKRNILGVDERTLETYGPVSELVAIEMAAGVRKISGSHWGLATTGIAGPDGGSDQNPVGSVWIGMAGPKAARAVHFQFGRNRERNIIMASMSALNLLRKEIQEEVLAGL